MTILRIIVLTALVFLFVGCNSSVQENNTHTKEKIAKILAQADKPPDAFDEVIAVLSQALKARPNDFSLLVTRANYYGALGLYKKSIDDIERASTLGDVSPEVLMSKCMYTEKIKGYNGVAQNCYDKVLSMYEDADSGSMSPSGNHVFAAIMAKSPKASELKKAFLSESNKPKRYKQLIKDFNRKQFIEMALP